MLNIQFQLMSFFFSHKLYKIRQYEHNALGCTALQTIFISRFPNRYRKRYRRHVICYISLRGYDVDDNFIFKYRKLLYHFNSKNFTFYVNYYVYEWCIAEENHQTHTETYLLYIIVNMYRNFIFIRVCVCTKIFEKS